MRGRFGVSILVAATILCLSCSTATIASNQTTANVIANEIVYGTENDELISAAATMNMGDIDSNPTTETGTDVFSGLINGTATVAHNVSWLETDSAGTPYNRTFAFSGTQIVTFSNYSNVAGRAIESGTVTVTIASGTLESSTPGANPSPDVGSTVTNTETDVKKTITGTVNGERNGNTYTCVLDLTVDVISRVTNWTLGSSRLTNPSIQSRDVTVTGTVEVNGMTLTKNTTTLNTVAPQ